MRTADEIIASLELLRAEAEVSMTWADIRSAEQLDAPAGVALVGSRVLGPAVSNACDPCHA